MMIEHRILQIAKGLLAVRMPEKRRRRARFGLAQAVQIVPRHVGEGFEEFRIGRVIVMRLGHIVLLSGSSVVQAS